MASDVRIVKVQLNPMGKRRDGASEKEVRGKYQSISRRGSNSPFASLYQNLVCGRLGWSWTMKIPLHIGK